MELYTTLYGFNFSFLKHNEITRIKNAMLLCNMHGNMMNVTGVNIGDGWGWGQILQERVGMETNIHLRAAL